MGKRPAPAESPTATKKVASSPSSAAGDALVPVAKPAETGSQTIPSSAAGVGPMIRPSLPTGNEAAQCDVEAFMKQVCRWCEEQLPQAIDKCPGLDELGGNASFWECSPLSIAEADDKGSLVGYKDPFDQAKCTLAISQKGMYEASMNINWLMVFAEGVTAKQLMGDQPTLADVQAGVASWFDFTEEIVLASPQDNAKKRIPYNPRCLCRLSQGFGTGCFQKWSQAVGRAHLRMVVVVAPIHFISCLLYTSPSPRDGLLSRMPSSA